MNSRCDDVPNPSKQSSVIYYTTVAICKDGVVYDLGEGEFPPQPPDEKIRKPKYCVINAFTCTLDEAVKLKKRSKK